MIECIFTIDYEIFGNGQGSLKELVYEPAEKLAAIFRKWNARFVVFVEVAELEMIESKGADPAIRMVKQQVKEFYNYGFELGLHLHPQWYNAIYQNGGWLLDYSEYNLCTLPRDRIVQIVDRAIDYLRSILGIPDFAPMSFRAGNWLFQPTRTAAIVLAERGIKVDSSVFKGGLQHEHELDYRNALKNGHYWNFSDRVDTSDPGGSLLEIPIHTQMVPFWKMVTTKRVGLQRKISPGGKTGKKRFCRLLDFMRMRYPLKFDFCKMTINELKSMVDRVVQENRKNPASYRPLVAIGHTKDLNDLETVDMFLSYLRTEGIMISTFADVVDRCNSNMHSTS